MSRTNPLKKKKRKAKKTLLIFGEGFDEEIFLKYLRNIYSYNCNVAISIKKGKGGNPRNIVIDADKIPGAYDKKLVILDDDKGKKEIMAARQESVNRQISLIENKPCLEYLLLSILDDTTENKAENYKRQFESQYISKNNRGDLKEYAKLFPRRLLELKRKSISELNDIINIMEGK